MPAKTAQTTPREDDQGPGGSVLARGARAMARGAKTGWRQLPRGAFARWLTIIAIGTIASFAFTAALTLAAKRVIPRSAWESWDRDVILAADTSWPISFTDAIIFESPGNILILLPLTLAAAAICLANRRVLWGIGLVLCYGLARLLILLGWGLWDRARPDLIGGGAASLKTHTFPSGHIVLVFTTYGLLAYFWIISTRNWIDRILAIVLLLSVAAVVTAGRLRLGAHWPTDMIGGAVIGIFWLAWNIAALELARRAGRDRAGADQ